MVCREGGRTSHDATDAGGLPEAGPFRCELFFVLHSVENVQIYPTLKKMLNIFNIY